MDKLSEEEVERCKMLVYEIDDMFSAIKTEVQGDFTNYVSRRYLKEKLDGIIQDIKCLDSIVNTEK